MKQLVSGFEAQQREASRAMTCPCLSLLVLAAAVVVAGSVPADDGWRMLDQYPSQYVSRERSVCCVCCLRTDQHGAVEAVE